MPHAYWVRLTLPHEVPPCLHRHARPGEPSSKPEQSELPAAHRGDRLREAAHDQRHGPQGARVLLQELQGGLQRRGGPALRRRPGPAPPSAQLGS